MNPDLSRRVGRAMMSLPLSNLHGEEHLAFLRAVSAAADFNALSDEYKRMILQAEMIRTIPVEGRP